MTNEQAQQVLDELNTVRIEVLNDEAKKLFEAIMKIADERDKLREELDLKDKIIDLMAKYIGEIDDETFCDEDKYERDIEDNVIGCDEDCQECVKQYFENKVKEG